MRSSPRPGSLIAGKYLLDRLLGQGGMGSVFAAQNTLTGKQVAIKCLNPDVATSPEASLRFKREAKASARVRHPNVVDVYDVISEDGVFFLIMEYLEGEPLSSLLASRATSLPDLIRIVTAAMRGVAAAHREGVIHRDIKPENIFLAREGDQAQVVPKVLDFGISKIHGTQDLALTAPGSALGTVLYMSIEQLHGVADLDLRADVYAFGVILYQAVTGCAPFDAETLPALIMRIMTEHAPAVKELRPDVPPKLAQIIEWAMARERDQRLPTLERFIAELEPFADDARYHYQLTRPYRTTPVPRAPTTPSEPLGMAPNPSARRKVPTQLAEPGSAETPFVTSAVNPHAGAGGAQTLLRAALAMVVLSGLTFVGWRLWQAGLMMPPKPLTKLLEPLIDRAKAAATLGSTKPPDPVTAAAAQDTLDDTDDNAAAAKDGAELEAVPPVLQPATTAGAATGLPNGESKPSGPSALPTETDARAASDKPRGTTRAPIKATVKPRPQKTHGTPAPEAADSRRVVTPPTPYPTGPTVAEPAATPMNQANCNPKFYLDSEGEKHFKPECYR